jgi:hypothetical protein
MHECITPHAGYDFPYCPSYSEVQPPQLETIATLRHDQLHRVLSPARTKATLNTHQAPRIECTLITGLVTGFGQFTHAHGHSLL